MDSDLIHKLFKEEILTKAKSEPNYRVRLWGSLMRVGRAASGGRPQCETAANNPEYKLMLRPAAGQ